MQGGVWGEYLGSGLGLGSKERGERGSAAVSYVYKERRRNRAKKSFVGKQADLSGLTGKKALEPEAFGG